MKKVKLLLIVFLALGLKVYSQDIADEDLYELSLEELMNIEITTASKSAEKQSDAPGIISVLTRDELDRFGGVTLRDVLERVPGLISSTTPYSNRSTMVVRGDYLKQNSSHILMLINGRPIREVQEGGNNSELFERFPLSIIEKVEVIRGPGSVLYGSDAFTAVINIVTVDAEEGRVSLAGLMQNGGGYKALADVIAKKGDLSVVAAGEYYKRSVWKAPYTSQNYVFIPNPPYFAVQDTTAILDIPDYGASAFLNLAYKGLSLNSTINQWNTLGTQMQNDVMNTKFFTNLGYNATVSDTWSMDFNVTYSLSKLDGQMLSKRNSTNIVAEWTNNIVLSDKSKLAIGGLFDNIQGTETNMQNPEQEEIISEGSRSGMALYAQIDYRLFNSLKVIGGLQANKAGKMNMNVLPRGGVIWNPFDRFSVKALYSQAYRAPSINELYMNFASGLFGDENLKPEKVSTFDLGFNYQGEQTQFGLSLFKSNMSDIIQPVFAPGSFERTYTNLQDVEFIGGELEGKYYVNKNLYFTGSLSYQTNESDTLENVTPVANFGAKGGVSVRTNNGITVSLFDIYQGDLDDRYMGTLNPNQGAYNLLHLHSQFELNSIFNFESKSKFSVIFDVNNIFDEEVYKWDWGGFTNDAIPTLPGRMVFFGIKATI